MRKAQLFQHLDFVARAVTDGRGRPFSHTVNCQNCRLVKRRWIKRAGGMRLMVLGEKNIAIGPKSRQFRANRLAQIQFLAEPVRQHRRKRPPAAGRDGEIRFQQPRKFQDWLVVKNHRVQLCRGEVRVPEAKLCRVARKVRIIFFAREPFFLRGGNDFAIHHQRGGRIVVIRRNTKNIAWRGHESKKRIECPGDAGVGGEDENGPQ